MITNSFPLVSILIISYNQKDFIEEALESALEQDYPNLEVVVADDGSTDGTAEIILKFAENYPGRLVPIVGQPNLGITDNSNRGLKHCNGKYVAFQGGDDVLLQGKISKQVEWFEESEDRALCYHDMDVFDSLTDDTLYFQSEYYDFHQGDADLIIKYGTYFGGTTVMIRIPEDRGISFDKRIPISSDWLFWFEVLENQKGKVGYIDGVYARYRRHGKNITNESEHVFNEALSTLNIIEGKHPKYRDVVRQKRTELFFLHSISLCKNFKLIEALKFLLLSFRTSRGIWISPIKLIANKFNRFIKNSIRKIKDVYFTVRYRQFDLYRSKKLGMKVGKNTLFVGRQLFGSEPYLIKIADNCLITDGVRFITHDGSIQVPMIKLGASFNAVYGKHSTFDSIKVGSNVFIGVSAILLPNTEIEEDCIVAAGAILSGHYPKGSVIAGSPAKVVSNIDAYWEKNKGRVLDLSSVKSVIERKTKIIESTKPFKC